MKINCPRCNSPQKFGRQKKETSEGYFEVFVQCSKCRYKIIVFEGDSATILNELEIEKLRIRALRDPALRERLIRKVKRRERLDKKRSDSRTKNLHI